MRHYQRPVKVCGNVVLLFEVTIETIVAPYRITVASDQQRAVIGVDYSTYTTLNATSKETVNSFTDACN